ncbi:MAG: hypothetical protein AB1540_08965 [Bdellovibrionota bacterium]
MKFKLLFLAVLILFFPQSSLAAFNFAALKSDWEKLSVQYSPTSFSKKDALISTASTAISLSEPALFQKEFFRLEFVNREGFVRAALVKLPRKPGLFFVCISGLGGRETSGSLKMCTEGMFLSEDYGVILLESDSSKSWIERNQRITTSGYESGWDLYLSLETLKQHPLLKDSMKSVLPIGVSMGGNDALYMAYFDSILDTNWLSKGLLVFSAPADRLEGFKYAFSMPYEYLPIKAGFKYFFYESYDAGRSILGKHTGYTPEQVMMISVEEIFENILFPLSKAYLSKFEEHFKNEMLLPFFIGKKSIEQYEVSDLIKQYETFGILNHLQARIIFIHAEDDPAVPIRLHEQNAGMSGGAYLFSTAYGGHAGFLSSYGPRWFEGLIKSYLRQID